MALLSQDAPDLMKSRLEQGVWLDQIERSYNAWFAAPNHKKPELLLAGPTLTWAESWMLTQPKELSASLKQYIIRSLTAQSRKSAGQREVVEAEQRRKDTVYRYLLITMALFALMVLAPGAIRDILGFQFEHSLPIDPDASGQVASDETMRPDGPREPQIADAVELALSPPVATEPPKLESGFAKLANAVQIQSDKGNERLASLLAAEFFRSLEATPPAKGPAKDDEQLREVSKSLVADAFLTRIDPVDAGIKLSDQSPAISCPASSRFVGISETRQLHVWDSTFRGSPATASARPRVVKSDNVDRDCARLVTISPDYELLLTPLVASGPAIKLGSHDADVIGIGFSGDGSKVVSVSRDSVGRIWDTRAARRLADLRVEETTLTGASLSLDGTRALTWSEEQVSHVWDASTGRLLGSLKGHQGPIVRGEFSADGGRVLTVSIDGTAILWNARSLEPLQLIKAEAGSILDARMSPDGRYVAAISESATVQIFDGQQNGAVAELSNGKGNIRAFTFSQDSKLVATVDWSGSISIWQSETGQRLTSLNRRGDQVASLMFSQDGKSLTALMRSGSIATWALTTGESDVHARIKAAGYTCLTVDERRQFGLPPFDADWCVAPPNSAPLPAVSPAVAPPTLEPGAADGPITEKE